MAHRSNLVQVAKKIEIENASSLIVDPFCGKEMEKHDTKHVLYQRAETFYFCSKDCMSKYLHQERIRKVA
jgi:YHS domain-containing protein